ncbi:hypothetical protein HO173_000589 [Letharia columbiana]|uniref:Uncharacterized protein n=1 Tax=Letharia columbiana TaxID=112416 RepID=A0A8H6G7C2_9LECA|nr:uncharacterized protein HO173_000589 [Letharia columbiana]KAF6241877.1 hypothetical protein HO173_000589 [Letharia columbiana]
MSNACETLSPRPAAVTGPTTTISADNYLGLESDREEGPTRSSRDKSVDLESGNAKEPSTQRNEMRFVSEAASKNETFWSKITKYWFAPLCHVEEIARLRLSKEACLLQYNLRDAATRPEIYEVTGSTPLSLIARRKDDPALGKCLFDLLLR